MATSGKRINELLWFTFQVKSGILTARKQCFFFAEYAGKMCLRYVMCTLVNNTTFAEPSNALNDNIPENETGHLYEYIDRRQLHDWMKLWHCPLLG